MSMTSTQTTTGGPRAEQPLEKSKRRADQTPLDMLEFFSPTTAVMETPPLRAANHIVLIFGTMVLAIFILFGVVHIDRIVVATGKIVSLTPESVVQPLNTSVVKTIAVSEGDIVRKGQLLAQLDPTFVAADTTAAKEQVDRYKTEVERLYAELHQFAYKPQTLTAGALVQESIYTQRSAAREAETRYYQGQIDAQKALMAQADADIRQYAKETGVNADVEKMREILERDQVGSRLDTLAAVNQRLESERLVLTSVQQYENAKQTTASLQGQLDNYNQQWFADVSQNLTDDNVQLATYQDQLEHAALNYKLVDLRAEQDSIVLSVAPVSPGAVVQPGQTLFVLVPVNAPLEVETQVTGNESGFVVTGQPAEIKFQTFPYTNFGVGTGTVRLVSADSFMTGSPAVPTGGTSSASNGSSGTTANSVFTGTNPLSAFYYDTRISLDRLKMRNVPKEFHVIPGMPVETDIKVGSWTIWDYLIERMLPIIIEGMREPS